MSYDSRYPPQGGYRRDYRGDRDAPSLPQRPTTRSERRHRDRRDEPSYQSSQHNHPSLPPRPPPQANSSDSYRPPSYSTRDDYQGRDRDSRYGDTRPRADAYPPPPGKYNDFRPPQGDFSFRVEKPPGVEDSPYDSYRPHDDRQGRNGHGGPLNNDSNGRPGNWGRQGRQGENRTRRDRRGERMQGGRPPRRPFVAAERELLSGSHPTGPERDLFDSEAGVTYRALDELSDSEEAEMDISGDESDEAKEPSNKRVRLTLGASASDNSTPKWSNPDPYTALPPPEAGQAKKKDVVQLIRKARVQAKESRSALPTGNEDFISLDFDDSDSSEEEVQITSSATRDSPRGVPGAPTGPRLPNSRLGQNAQEATRPGARSLSDAQPQVIDLTDRAAVVDLTESPPSKGSTTLAPPIIIPINRRSSMPDPTPSALGSRKRTHDDEIKPPPHARLKKPARPPVGGSVTSEWRAKQGDDACPWIRADHSRTTPQTGVWLHKEIVDFYDFVKPRDFEERIRNEIVQELKDFCRRQFRDAEVYPFGSFPSGLYLPTGDMDLVFLSDQFLKGGRSKYDTKGILWKLDARIRQNRLALRDEIEIISHAKVPLVKYIEKKTGLKIDISFENMTGLQAVKTFTAWKEQYPAMPILVTVIKQFLAMRGLNEPVNGGIGGFSVICLVVSMLQQMPQVQSRSMNTQHHLGELLMEFFDLYGNRFNYQTTAISLNPPKYIPKNKIVTFAYKNYDRLSIIDPNNPENDISGGSNNTSTILTLFSEAHRLLSKRLAELAQSRNRRNASILEVILAGNYSSFQSQREHLQRLSERT
ncbi:hypothetical protein QBC46DRAFT_69321 [Diplogelasinospora grovesii]|uniref:polynucleotide adenylyltransferase n=1 Tax=Diplogelasinospora grovesii TaxID=303347 RepID=A0AAN6NBC7_9PEZI|nr:hypothetical protein QBC46DRAFT_69321 [Diplogelasinospora grovesii]